MWQQWANALVGVWLIIASFFDFSASVMTTNLLVSGLIVAILGLWGALSEQQHHMGQA